MDIIILKKLERTIFKEVQELKINQEDLLKMINFLLTIGQEKNYGQEQGVLKSPLKKEVLENENK